MHFNKNRNHIEDHNSYKGLSINKGEDQTPSLNPDAAKKFLSKKRKDLTLKEYVDGILSGNITILSRAVTLIESSLPSHREMAQKIIMECLPYSGKSVRLGITGVPGAGKSTFIEALGSHLINQGSKLAVLAIDPSSEKTKGSILGDKTRMERLSSMEGAYIRPSPSAGSLGGVARKTRETIILCEAAGYDNIFIETVGVGQSETAVHSMVDFFLLILIAGAGDELQGIKRGIMEMADGIAINKADGENIKKAELAKSQYSNALHLFPPSPSSWAPKVETCSSLSSSGVADVWKMVMEYVTLTRKNNYFEQNRREQSQYWMYESINEALKENFYQNSEIKERLKELEKLVVNGKISSFEAAGTLLEKYFKIK
ncbi:methylmalonyl Co-A mutase-associated GTPase MeaB [Marinilabiliaceae bacterium ANBcel2]|nr:methylmalonyl Co-A mutase-associated GTPase MeaB [Marinilabiliaceae bacterium ANBcel2]